MDPITLRYRSKRREVWGFYWWCWRQPKGLWRIHLATMGAVFAIVFLMVGLGDPTRGLVLAASAAFAAVAWMPLTPLMFFKSQERTLVVGAEGLITTIGHGGGKQRWSDVMTILDRGDTIALVGKSLNGFVIPRRAFAETAKRAAFLVAIRAWHRAAAGHDAGYDVERSSAKA